MRLALVNKNEVTNILETQTASNYSSADDFTSARKPFNL
jgi:hypothetical protein